MHINAYIYIYILVNKGHDHYFLNSLIGWVMSAGPTSLYKWSLEIGWTKLESVIIFIFFKELLILVEGLTYSNLNNCSFHPWEHALN